MKKIIFSLVVLSLLISAPAFAEETSQGGMPVPVGQAQQNQIVLTNDGGVIVLVGPNLLKYDADLNLVKEAQVKMPTGPMNDMKTPMMGKWGQVRPDTALVAAESQEKPIS